MYFWYSACHYKLQQIAKLCINLLGCGGTALPEQEIPEPAENQNKEGMEAGDGGGSYKVVRAFNP